MAKEITESKRAKAFRLAIAKGLPKFPNDKSTLRQLENASLGTLLIHYNNWATRYVAPRPRAVTIEATATTDPRWSSMQVQINAFLDKAAAGEDLAPYLSLEPHTRGYTPAAAQVGIQVDRWVDKDFLLNVMGYHHFHLGVNIELGGFAGRTDDLLFARVFRASFTVIGIFDHSVFEGPIAVGSPMTKERERLWSIFEEHSSRGVIPGTIYAPAIITTSGHSMHVVRMAQDYARIVRDIDPKLDDMNYIKYLYDEAKVVQSKNPSSSGI